MSAHRIQRLLNTISILKAENKTLRESLAMKLVDLKLQWSKDNISKHQTGMVSVCFPDLELVVANNPEKIVRDKLHAALDLLINAAIAEHPALEQRPTPLLPVGK